MPTPERISLLKNFSWRILPASLLVLAFVAVSSAAGPVRFKTWNTGNGLPQNSIQAIAQTPDGYLWIATRDGLARFDGIRFKVFQKSNTPELPTNRLWFMFADEYGRLWIFPEATPQLIVYENGSFKAFHRGADYEFAGVPESWGEDGATVFTNAGTDFVYKDGAFTRRPAVLRKREVGLDPLGNGWIDDGTNYYSIKDGVVTTHARNTENPLTLGKTTPPSISFLYSAAPVHPGRESQRAYVRLGDAFWFFQFIDREMVLVRLRHGKLDASNVRVRDATAMISDRSSNIWIGRLDGGLVRLNAASLKFDDISSLQPETLLPAQGLASPTVTSLFRDRDGNLWVGGYDGLQLVKDDPVVNIIPPEHGSPFTNVYAVDEAPDGSIWFGSWAGTGEGKVARYTEGLFQTFDQSLVTAITHDRAGRVLIGANGFVWTDVGGRLEQFDLEGFGKAETGTQPVNEVSFISEDRAGNLWVGGSQGLLKYHDGVVRRYKISDGLPSEALVAFLETKAGEIWVGTTAGLARLDGDRFTPFRKAEGLGGEFVRSLYEDRDGTLWIGTYDSGIVRYNNGEFRAIAKKDGLFSDGVFCILEDDDGWFWMNSNQGIYRARRQDLNDFADGRMATIASAGYGPEDGLQNVEGNGGKQPAGLRSSDGRLWFPTAGGLAVIDPKRVHRDEKAPDVLIEEIKIDQKDVARTTDELTLKPGQTGLEINYTGIKFNNPDRLRFRYKLEGLDDNWTEAGSRRTAYFSHLPYGEYTFRVLAANRDGVWNDQGAAMRILIDRPFYRTYWFYALMSFFVIGFVGLVYVARIRQLRSIAEARELYARELLESQERERSRLAMELHDSLGQSLVVIRNRALIGIGKRESGEAMLDQLQEISDASAIALKETREIAHTLHPYQIEALGLTTALHSLVDKFENASEIEFAVAIDQVETDVPHDAAIAIYRIAQEWLTNIVKHASARSVSVSLLANASRLELEIVDDGVGFDPHTVKKGLGLKGIEERSRMVGASLSVSSTPGAGSSLTLIVEKI